MWTKERYNKNFNQDTEEWEDSIGYWVLTDGRLRLDVHPLYDGSGRKEEYPDGVIVSPEQAEEYADKILVALNEYSRLASDSDFLQALHAAGVDSWDGYEEAQEMLD